MGDLVLMQMHNNMQLDNVQNMESDRDFMAVLSHIEKEEAMNPLLVKIVEKFVYLIENHLKKCMVLTFVSGFIAISLVTDCGTGAITMVAIMVSAIFFAKMAEIYL